MIRDFLLASLPLVLGATLAGCTVDTDDPATSTTTTSTSADAPGVNDTGEAAASGEIITCDIQGSSTVYPVAAMVSGAVTEQTPNYVIPVGKVGSGPGITAAINGEADIANASRKIKDSELETAAEKNITLTELVIALDGIAVVVNKENDWVQTMSVEQLNQIWKPGETAPKWSDIDPDWPDKKIVLYGPDAESGTFEYFTKVINGEKGATTTDYSPGVNDNQLVKGVAGDKYAMGYFGYSYLAENTDSLTGLTISQGGDPVAPSVETIQSGEYKPLARPLYIYINNQRYASNPAAQAFVEKMVSDEGQELVTKAGMVPLDAERLEQARAKVAELPKN